MPKLNLGLSCDTQSPDPCCPQNLRSNLAAELRDAQTVLRAASDVVNALVAEHSQALRRLEAKHADLRKAKDSLGRQQACLANMGDEGGYNHSGTPDGGTSPRSCGTDVLTPDPSHSWVPSAPRAVGSVPSACSFIQVVPLPAKDDMPEPPPTAILPGALSFTTGDGNRTPGRMTPRDGNRSPGVSPSSSLVPPRPLRTSADFVHLPSSDCSMQKSCTNGAAGGTTFELHPAWNHKTRRASTFHSSWVLKGVPNLVKAPTEAFGTIYSARSYSGSLEDIAMGKTEAGNPEDLRQRILKRIKTIHPSSRFRFLWDTMCVVLVAFDMVIIPLQLFKLPEVPSVVAAQWLLRIFWTADLVISCFTGELRRDGSFDLDFRRVSRKYLRTWFPVDSLCVLLDWSEVVWLVALSASSDRIITTVRLLRLLRMVKMQKVLRLIIERQQSERLMIVAEIFRIMFVLGGFAHLVACFWWGVGQERTIGWASHYGMENRTLGYQYTASLHWAVAQFTGGMDEFVPQTTRERSFAIAAFLCAFILASIFVSGLTSSMTRLVLIGSRDTQSLTILRRYLAQNHIPDRLALRVQRNAQQAILDQQRSMPEEQVMAMKLVSEPLKMDVHFEMYSKVLRLHPFFASYTEECPQVIRVVCHCAMDTLRVSRGDVLFAPGESPSVPRMYILKSGSMQYVSMSARVFHVHEKECISEATLWTTWVHQGQLTANTDCRICTLEAQKFQDIALQFEYPDFDPRRYAASYVRDLNQRSEEGEATDLQPKGDPESEATERRKMMPMTMKRSERSGGSEGATSRAKVRFNLRSLSITT